MDRRSFITLSLAAAAVARAAESESSALLSFGLITDVQYADADPNGERHYRESPAKLKEAVESIAKKNLPFTLHLGDFIDRDFTAFDTVLPLLGPLGHPVHHLLGNHDYSVADGEKGRIVAKLSMPHDYYSVEKSGVRIVMIDTNDRSVYKYPKDSPQNLESEELLKKLTEQNSGAAKPWNGGVSEAQLTWLNGELAAATAAKQSVILCGHHPLLPEDGFQSWNNTDLLAMIDKHPCVVAYFCGHNHAGAEVMRNNIPYITFKSVLHEPGVNSWAVIHLHKDKLEIEGYGREKSRVIPLRSI